jgi:hypothetical protein
MIGDLLPRRRRGPAFRIDHVSGRSAPHTSGPSASTPGGPRWHCSGGSASSCWETHPYRGDDGHRDVLKVGLLANALRGPWVSFRYSNLGGSRPLDSSSLSAAGRRVRNRLLTERNPCPPWGHGPAHRRGQAPQQTGPRPGLGHRGGPPSVPPVGPTMGGPFAPGRAVVISTLGRPWPRLCRGPLLNGSAPGKRFH